MQEEQKEVDRIEALLREHGHSVEPVGAEAEAGGQETDYQIYMGVERVRVSEVIFQPSMVGIDAMPLDYLAQHILSSLPPEAQSALEKVIPLLSPSCPFFVSFMFFSEYFSYGRQHIVSSNGGATPNERAKSSAGG